MAHPFIHKHLRAKEVKFPKSFQRLHVALLRTQVRVLDFSPDADPARRIRGCNGQIHMDYKNPVEKKGWHGHSLSERGREGQSAWPLPGQAFIAFLGTLHWGWSSFTMHSFAVGDYLLQVTKERMLLITSKRRMLQIKGKSGWTDYTPYLGGLARTLGS